MKRTNEEILKEQGIEQVNIYEVMYPDEKKEQEKPNEKHISGFKQSSIRANGTS